MKYAKMPKGPFCQIRAHLMKYWNDAFEKCVFTLALLKFNDKHHSLSIK